MAWWLALVLSQDQGSQEQRVRAAMESSIEQQRASVRQQAQAAGAPSLPWTPALTAGGTASAPCDPMPKLEIDAMIGDVASAQKIDPAIVREVARQESGFRPCAVSAKGAEGLMQLMPATQAALDVHDPFNARASLEGGSKLLKQLLDKYHGDLKLALSAYNAGSGRVDKAGGVPAIAETRNYVAAIIARLMNRVPY